MSYRTEQILRWVAFLSLIAFALGQSSGWGLGYISWGRHLDRDNSLDYERLHVQVRNGFVD